MPKFQINKSILIKAAPEKIYQTVSDFHHWQPWSPWLICEPEAKVNVREDGKYYDWSGKRVGDGNMTVTNESPNNRIDYDLTFLKPWKSSSKVSFILQPQGDTTRVSWTMDGSLPFFLFWMKKSMIAYIGADYTRGLSMLKEYVEDGAIKSKLDFKGKGDYAGCQYIGIKTETTLAEIGDKMQSDFERLLNYAKDNVEEDGLAFSIYHKWDVVKGKGVYTAAQPVRSIPDNLPAGFISGSIPATKTYTVRHTGAYGHLGNAWSSLYMMIQNKELRPIKSIHPFETYLNDPKEVAETDLVTEISFAVK